MIKIRIEKATRLAWVTGGDYGPGVSNGDGGIMYQWNLPVAQIEPDTTKQQLITRTLGNTMNTIGSAVMLSAGSYCSGGSSGNYTDPQLSFSITNTQDVPVSGQIQVHGVEIDLRYVDDPGFAELSKLPVGTYTATPCSNGNNVYSTSNLLLTIE